MKLHPLIRKAGEEEQLPKWARCDPKRIKHVRRVSRLMGEWAKALGLSRKQVVRWKAAGYLHDALKDAGPEELRPLADGRWPAKLLHGPACAERLRRAGVDDEEFLLAMSYHSTGHPDFGLLADYLYLADYLEPGRTFRRKRRASLREKLPEDRQRVLKEVIQLRVAGALSNGHEVLLESIHYWNRLVASEE
ncbi:MAG: HD domain-containing protein [Gemmatimonadota bacterium]